MSNVFRLPGSPKFNDSPEAEAHELYNPVGVARFQEAIRNPDSATYNDPATGELLTYDRVTENKQISPDTTTLASVLQFPTPDNL